MDNNKSKLLTPNTFTLTQPMIISASRRTDIPAYYSEWFFKRLQEGYCYTTNPMNPKIFYKIPLDQANIDAIIFWSKNPYPMLKKLHLLNGYAYYFQYTITPYSPDIEKNLPMKKYLVDTFIRLSERIGKNRIIWRYDPILFNTTYTYDYHIRHFKELCQKLAPYTTKVIISFLSIYRKIQKTCEKQKLYSLDENEKNNLLKTFAKICFENGLRMEICSQELPRIKNYPVFPARCIDLNLINELTNKKLIIKKDPNQRELCGCAKSCDIGMYNSCYNGCIYCYASYQNERLEENKARHDAESPILLGELPKHAQIIERNINTLANDQLLLI